MKFSALLLLLVLAIAASLVPSAYGLQTDVKGTHLRQLQDQSGDQEPPEEPVYPNEQPSAQQPNVPIILTNAAGGGDVNTNTNPSSNEILIGGCFPGGWNWPRCRFGCFPGSWTWPRCRFGGGGGCFPGSWNWPRCRFL
ncbi:uncharacterized protein IUM83_00356 [Phytophthora cinnamomi]|uniref:uncharacterized protein n=1 Tax=Phytophthora cinnamomi TaxID=4785 RepID=UPI0035599DF0|nr:hypothetical protein IUM83_00356 [Phytophthora cinnamomi]